ncbi:MAG: hypothetical protein HYR60_18650 [Acidobacteria bacterium]|nr:hypothetical protein [Acidobacteriota bacterium]
MELSRRGLLAGALAAGSMDERLAGYWPLRGDARDSSGRGNHGVRKTAGERESYVEVPHHPSLDFGAGDFSLCAWVHTEKDPQEVPGDILTKYDPVRRRGFNWSLQSSAGGYNSHGTDRQVFFGIDSGSAPGWEECGRPSPTSNYVSNSLTVFDGHLYAGTTDGATVADWCHVYRYAGGARWEDCGRVGNLRTRGVGPLIVHDGALYAATWSYDWRRVATDRLDLCRVYRHGGGQSWEDCGQPGACRRLFGIASFRGRLYITGDDNKCHVHEGGKSWRAVREFPSLAHPMLVHGGKLHIGAFAAIQLGGFKQAIVETFDGSEWASLGCPLGSAEHADQIHDLEVYHGKLHATTWPTGKVAVFDGGRWVDCGRLGDSTEINALAVYNGKLYAGTIPRAEVFRYEGGQEWRRIRRFFAPEGWEPIPVGANRGVPDGRKRMGEWTRVTSLTSYRGRLFAGIGGALRGREAAIPVDRRAA